LQKEGRRSSPQERDAIENSQSILEEDCSEDDDPEQRKQKAIPIVNDLKVKWQSNLKKMSACMEKA